MNKENNLKSLNHYEMVSINGGTIRNPDAYEAGVSIGNGVRRGLAIVGIWLLFL